MRGRNSAAAPEISRARAPAWDLRAVAFLALAVMATILLFSTLNNPSLWLDEVCTVAMGDPRWGLGYGDAQMPLAYLMVFLSKVLLGSRELAFRFPFALLSLALVLSLPRYYAEHGFNPIAACLAPLALLLFPDYLYYSQEARAYMPMIAMLFFWGWYRERLSGWRAFLLCTLALQSNTFSVIFVGSVVALDLLFARGNKAIRAHLPASLLALLAHVPSLLYVVARIGWSRTPALHGGAATSAGFFSYLLSAWRELTPQNSWGWLFLSGISVAAVMRLRTASRTLWTGIGLGLCIQAVFLSVSGWPLYSRYLLPMLLLFNIPAFLIPLRIWQRAIPYALALILAAHASIGAAPHREKAAWPGVLARHFPAVARELAGSRREGWKDLARFLGLFAKPGDSVSFRDCAKCSPYALDFYLQRLPPAGLRLIEGEKCPTWLVSASPNLAFEPRCKRFPVVAFDQLFVYGPAPLTTRPGF